MIENSSKQALEEWVDKGELLLDMTKGKENYVFNFEGGAMSVPLLEIAKVEPQLERWQTKVIFSDGAELTVPTKGTNLDFIVEGIKLNPSGLNPLAALVNVWLPTYGRVKITVQGRHGENGTITHWCQDGKPRQAVPVLGLYADYENVVKLTFTSMDGKERGSTIIRIRTDALRIQDFPKWKQIKAQPQKMEPGVTLVNYPGQSEADVSIPYMIDNEGEIRWLLLFKASSQLQKLSFSIGLKRTKKGTFIAGDQSQPRIIEVDVFGNLLQQWDLKKLGYTFHHEITEAANGNFLVNVSKSSAKLNNGQPRINDYIIELDPLTGGLVREWDLADQLDTTRYLKPDANTPAEFGPSASNWAHNNAIGEIGNNLLTTLRYQGISSFDRSGNLRWIISPHKYWGLAYQSYLLKPIDESGNMINDPAVINGEARTSGFDWSWGPHSPVALAEDRILVFDNGYNRNWISNFAPGVMSYSRVVEYKIDLTKKTVQQIWSYGEEWGTQGFSQAVSGVQYLDKTGNVLFCPGMGVSTSIGSGGRVVEINPKTKEVVYELEIVVGSGFAFHRATRISLYPEYL
ncbi:aryl-sulfate sulfotransferase [Sphingobacterium yanglingense]|uniref:Arylsulfate sulfotransferase n=1 Tax=Sphingobacterium yanglingense TaxID=1437280 RepID=A0A4R6WE88_9SPHI|nr:aryl-sulfate sulfotransferase [Sphingobacterium yanglingense]TDQ76313.1 arylsulfate sulfotransferase [Sphingobacterium yanglingense]